MDYNEFLMNFYIINLGPMTASEWFRITMQVIQGGGMATGFLTIMIESIGKETIQGWLIDAEAYWQWDIVKMIGNGEWVVWQYIDCGDQDASVCAPTVPCGSSDIYNDSAPENPDKRVCVKWAYE